jgi:hypothetical protein
VQERREVDQKAKKFKLEKKIKLFKNQSFYSSLDKARFSVSELMKCNESSDVEKHVFSVDVKFVVANKSFMLSFMQRIDMKMLNKSFESASNEPF